MRIDHIACWTKDIDRLAAFYTRYFNVEIKPLYYNPAKQFTSRFLVFPDGGRLEVMHNPDIQKSSEKSIGFVHLAISVGSKEAVDNLVETMRVDGFPSLDGPRWTGDGYYEAVVQDPDGNRIEITL